MGKCQKWQPNHQPDIIVTYCLQKLSLFQDPPSPLSLVSELLGSLGRDQGEPHELFSRGRVAGGRWAWEATG